ncbi:hypothetical protein [Bacillus nitroreducens]
MRSIYKMLKPMVRDKEFIPVVESASKTKRLVVGGLLGSLAMLLQSAGVFAGLGYVLSMMSTGPLVIACLLSSRIGAMTYVVTIILLFMFQPSELLIFTFTTGLLGLSMGIGLKYLKKNIMIISFSALCLSLGIAVLLYVVKFSILGPAVMTDFNGMLLIGIYLFSFVYSWIWLRISIFGFKIFGKISTRR